MFSDRASRRANSFMVETSTPNSIQLVDAPTRTIAWIGGADGADGKEVASTAAGRRVPM